MHNSKVKLAINLIVAIILTLGLSISLQSILAAAWQAPSSSPPDDNTNPPVYNETLGDPATSAYINRDVLVAGNLIVGNVLDMNAANIKLNNNWLTGDGNDGEGIYIDNNGNVGIGTNIPTAKLDISGSMKIISGLPTDTRPDCDDSRRGMIWYQEGDATHADIQSICLKRSDNTYKWKDVETYTGAWLSIDPGDEGKSPSDYCISAGMFACADDNGKTCENSSGDRYSSFNFEEPQYSLCLQSSTKYWNCPMLMGSMDCHHPMTKIYCCK